MIYLISIKVDKNSFNFKQVNLEIWLQIMFFINRKKISICLGSLTLKEKLKRIKNVFLAAKLQKEIFKNLNRCKLFKNFKIILSKK
jgi:hypothetical protein